jgi:hypothetical protein
MYRIALACTLLFALLTTNAVADVSEDRYATDFFGTVARFEVDYPVIIETEYGYWSDNMDERMYDGYFLAEKANAVRKRQGKQPLSDDIYLYITTQEVDSSTGYAYTIAFQWLTPDEVREILKSVNNLNELLPGARISFSPLKQRFFDVNVFNLDAPLVFDDYGIKLTFAPGVGAKAILPQLTSALKKRFGDQTVVDSLYYSESIYALGEEGSRILSFQVNVDPDQYSGYDG